MEEKKSVQLTNSLHNSPSLPRENKEASSILKTEQGMWEQDDRERKNPGKKIYRAHGYTKEMNQVNDQWPSNNEDRSDPQP